MNKKLLFAFIFGIFLFSFVSAVNTTDLVSYYKLDDNATNTTVADAHGSNDGTASANTNTLSTTGKINNSFDFVASNTEYVDFGDSTWDSIFSSDFSISLWVKLDTVSEVQSIAGKWFDGTRVFNIGTGIA